MRFTSIIFAAAGLAAPAFAEPPPGAVQPAPNNRLTPVDTMHADVGPVRTSTRQVQPDLRTPLNFDEVYRVSGLPGNNGPQFARVNGALSAVFSRSQYHVVQLDKKTQAMQIDVPAGTVFYIGDLPNQQQGANAPRGAPVPTRVDTSASTPQVRSMVEAIIPAGADEPSSSVIPAVPKPDRRSVGTPPSDGKRRAEPVPLSVMNDEPFRQSRVRELIAQAAAAPKPEPATAEKPAPPSKEPGTAAANER